MNESKYTGANYLPMVRELEEVCVQISEDLIWLLVALFHF